MGIVCCARDEWGRDGGREVWGTKIQMSMFCTNSKSTTILSHQFTVISLHYPFASHPKGCKQSLLASTCTPFCQITEVGSLTS